MIIEWLATFLAVTGTLAAVLRLQNRSRFVKIGILAFLAGVIAVPIGGLYVFQYFLTVVGHISITAMIMLAGSLARRLTGRDIFVEGERGLLLAAIVIAGLAVFAATFELTQFNIYQLGFGSLTFGVLLMAFALVLLFAGKKAFALIIAASVLAYDLHLLPSSNLWDHLLDPTLWIYALAVLAWNAVRNAISRRRLGTIPIVESQ